MDIVRLRVSSPKYRLNGYGDGISWNECGLIDICFKLHPDYSIPLSLDDFLYYSLGDLISGNDGDPHYLLEDITISYNRDIKIESLVQKKV